MKLPVRLAPSFREKPWGGTALAPWFPDRADKIGEVWFERPEQPLPILIKFLFTTENLSVQVHPPDRPGAPAKTEAWHILRAAPGASIALGFRQPLSREGMQQAAASGEIVRLLEWFPVAAGETYLVPAGTVHAIGAGIALCEIQQNTDVTYRLYDYGRPRELHLDQGLQVADPGPHPGRTVPFAAGQGRWLLAECAYFATELLEFPAAFDYWPRGERFELLAVLEGCGKLGGQRFQPGEVWLAEAGCSAFQVRPEGRARLLRSWLPARR